MIQQVEGLHLQRDALALGDRNLSRESQVDLLRPGPVKRIQPHHRAGASPVDSQGRVGRALVDSAVVQTAAGSYTIQLIQRNSSQGRTSVRGVVCRACVIEQSRICLLYTSPSPRDRTRSRM